MEFWLHLWWNSFASQLLLAPNTDSALYGLAAFGHPSLNTAIAVAAFAGGVATLVNYSFGWFLLMLTRHKMWPWKNIHDEYSHLVLFAAVVISLPFVFNPFYVFAPFVALPTYLQGAIKLILVWLFLSYFSLRTYRINPERYDHLRAIAGRYGVWLLLFPSLPLYSVLAVVLGFFRVKPAHVLALSAFGLLVLHLVKIHALRLTLQP